MDTIDLGRGADRRKPDQVPMIGRVVARGQGSGTPVHQPIFTAVTVRNGKVAQIEDQTEKAKALEAAGLRE